MVPAAVKAKIEDIPEEFFEDPLDYFHADHFRQRTLCNLLDDMIESGAADRDTIAAMLEYLKRDLGLHLRDEEDDLFPLLRRHCLPEDNLENILGVLSEEHAKDEELCVVLVEGLQALLDGEALRNHPRLIAAASTFTETQRRHLTWENGLLLPLARKRLTQDDLVNLGRSIAARHAGKA